MNIERSQIYQIVAAASLLIAIGLLSSGPVEDGDFWWQIAYGRYMVENGTLIPDHSIYSWSSANSAWIYCAWLAEIMLFYAYQAFGILGGALFRYASMITPAIVLLCLVRYRHYKLDYSIWFYLFICYSISRHAGGLIKPELFSHMLFAVVVGLYFAIKSDSSRSVKLIYALPAVLSIWINTHAGFIVGMFFFGIVIIGELINLLLRAEDRLSNQQWRAVWICVPLAAVVFLSTPYGYNYPVQLIGEFFAGDHTSAYQNVTAYSSIYDEKFSHLGVKYFTAIAVLLLLPLLLEAQAKKRTDYALIFANIVIFSLSASWGRFSYFSPILMFFTFAHLINRSELWFHFKNKKRFYDIGAIVSIVIILGVSSYISNYNSNSDPRGPSFGPGYLNPVSETEYIREHLEGVDLCNGYNGGGYLLWALGPSQKIMIDPRYFPYAEWYQKWIDIQNSKTPGELLKEFECGAWVINHTYDDIIPALVDSDQWAPVFMGAAGVVFAKKEKNSPNPPFLIDEEVASIRSLPREAHILNLLLRMNEYNLAKELSSQARKYWASSKNEIRAIRADDFISASTAFKSSNDKVAYPLFKTANQSPGVLSNLNRQRLSGQYLTETLWRDKRYTEALQVAQEVFYLNRNDIISVYNIGFLQLSVASKINTPNASMHKEWKESLVKFINMAENRPGIPPKYISHAKLMLSTQKPVNAPPLVPVARPPFKPSNLGTWQFQG